MSDSAVAKRPMMANVLGILNVVFGGITLITSLSALLCVNEWTQLALVMVGVSPLIGTLLSLLGLLLAGTLLAAGIMLLIDKKLGILLSMIYAIGSFVMTVINIVVYSFGFNAFGYLIGLAYPIVLLVLVLRPVIKNFYADKN